VKIRALASGYLGVAAVVIALTAMLALPLALGAYGCSSNGPGETATTASGTSVGPSAVTSPSSSLGPTTTSLPELLSDWDRELAETAKVQNQLATYLADQGAAEDDPRLAVVFGLRARTQAITGRQALSQGDLDLADMAMKDVYPTLNRGRNIADGEVSQILEDAYATIAALGVPSDRPQEAAASLDEFIAGLQPLLDQAKALTPAG
jgi:hypothetical protein